MLKSKLTRTSLVALAVVLMLSIFSMTVFAEEVTLPANDLITSAAPADGAAESVDTEAVADSETLDDTATESEAAAEDAVEDKTEESAEESEKSEETGKVDTTGTTTEKEGFKLSTNDIVSLVILGVVVIGVAVYCIVKREKVGAFFRSLKSEFKKISWSPWNQVRKNTIVVVVVVVVIAVLVGLLDLLFNQAIVALGRLF